MPAIIGIWLIGATVVAFFGQKLRFGFWGYFFASILLTPVIGVLLLIAAVPTRKERKARRRAGL